MNEYQSLLESFVRENINILGDELTGIYLHGSAVMGCFNPEKSDLDLLVVVKGDIPDEGKRRYMDMVIELNQLAPAKGLELSIVRENVCKPFVYPTPYELHFSVSHLDWYRSAPEDYIARMKGTDRDLAAHFTIIYHRGRTLYGKEIPEVFSPVSPSDYFDSIRFDIEHAKEEITDHPMYITLNLCRVLAYKKDRLILSKAEGGEWGLGNIPDRYHHLISAALTEYRTGGSMALEEPLAKEYAEYMLAQIMADCR